LLALEHGPQSKPDNRMVIHNQHLDRRGCTRHRNTVVHFSFRGPMASTTGAEPAIASRVRAPPSVSRLDRQRPFPFLATLPCDILSCVNGFFLSLRFHVLSKCSA